MEVSSSGASGVRKINVSTLTALIAGEPEVPVIKHSFWKVTGIAGSADVLHSVGIFTPGVSAPADPEGRRRGRGRLLLPHCSSAGSWTPSRTSAACWPRSRSASARRST